jgi:hypothetical protein
MKKFLFARSLIEHNSHPASNRRSYRLPLALTGLMLSPWAGATNYSATLTGVQATDSANGYLLTAPSGGPLAYAFGVNDSITVWQTQAADAYGLLTTNATAPIVLDTANSAGTLSISATRGTATHGAINGGFGSARGLDVVSGKTVTVNGATSIHAETDDPVSGSGSESRGINVNQGTLSLNGNVQIDSYSKAYSRGLYVYQGNLNFNGTTTILTQAPGTDNDGIYNSGGGRSAIRLNGNTKVSALSIWPSDNAHAVYNDNQNSQLYVNGTLALTAVSQGSTVFGIRNQGRMIVSQDASIEARGPRSAFGAANTHDTAYLEFDGKADISVMNTTNYTPFGLPTAISINYSSGNSYIRFKKSVHANVAAATTAFGIDNVSQVYADSSADAVVLSVGTTCTSCDVYGIRNTGGTIGLAGGVSIMTSPGSTGTAYALWNVPTSTHAAAITLNSSATQPVRLNGRIVTGAATGSNASVLTATTTLTLSTADSYLKGAITGDQADANTYLVGNTVLSLTNGARWVFDPAFTRNDLGTGSLVISRDGMFDLSAAATATASITGSTTGAALTAGDGTAAGGAILNIASDITGLNGAAIAGRLAWGSGLSSVAVTSPLQIAIASDPLLTSGTITDSAIWTTYPSAVPLVVLDGSMTSAAGWQFPQPVGVVRTVSVPLNGVTRQIQYQPDLAVSNDGRQILLTGLMIRVLAQNPSADYVSLSPSRLLDTRTGTTTVDGVSAGTGALGPGETRVLQVGGRGGVPSSAVIAAALNVTAVNPPSAGYLTVWSGAGATPLASNLNLNPGHTIPNLVISQIDSAGRVSIYNGSSSATEVVVDVQGYLPSGTSYVPMTPARLLDTRRDAPFAQTTVDGIDQGVGALPVAGKFDLDVGGRAGIPIIIGAAILNVTAVTPPATGYITAWPFGASQPLASNLNLNPNLTVPNLVVAGVGSHSGNSAVSLYNGSTTGTPLIADVQGYFPTTSGYTALVPKRLLDTRTGQTSCDGVKQYSGAGAISSGARLDLTVTGRCGAVIPATGVGTVVLNVTAVVPTAPGYVTVWPTGASQPLASNLNLNPGTTIPNTVIAKVGAQGQISIYNGGSAPLNIVVDAEGWFRDAP